MRLFHRKSHIRGFNVLALFLRFLPSSGAETVKKAPAARANLKKVTHGSRSELKTCFYYRLKVWKHAAARQD